MKLYYSPQSRGIRPRWLLEELGVPYDLVTVDLSKGEQKKPEHLKVHPLGAVPALEDGDLTMFESAAICAYLADKYADKGLAPPVNSPARGLYQQWLFFAMATAEPPVVDVFLHTVMLPEGQRKPEVAEAGKKRWHEVGAVLDRALEGRQFLLGDQFTAADVMIGSITAWGSFMGLLEGHPNLQEYAKRMSSRPAFQRA
jgi:glutathione S-transferase